MTLPTDFNRWVNDNNPPDHLEYRKGWWDYVEIIRRLMLKYGVEAAEVIGTYVMKTPPPPEELLMPVVKLQVGGTTLILKYDFGVWPECWTISTKRQDGYVGPTFGLFDEREDLRSEGLPGFEPRWVYPPYCDSPTLFSCKLRDEWDVAAFVRLVSYNDA